MLPNTLDKKYGFRTCQKSARTHLCGLKTRKVKNCFEKQAPGHSAYGDWQPTALIPRDSVHSTE